MPPCSRPRRLAWGSGAQRLTAPDGPSADESITSSTPAFDAGIRLLDTADVYGASAVQAGLSEPDLYVHFESGEGSPEIGLEVGGTTAIAGSRASARVRDQPLCWIMLETLKDLFAHQAWADAVHWHVIASHPGALEDQSIRVRLHHIHTVQAAFLALARGEAPTYADIEDDTSMDEVKGGAIAFHEEAAAWLSAASPERLAAVIDIPWFRDPPCRIPIGNALLQAASHSQYHRGQNATRLRELGKKPPTTDLIVWYWKGRPSPRWS